MASVYSCLVMLGQKQEISHLMKNSCCLLYIWVDSDEDSIFQLRMSHKYLTLRVYNFQHVCSNDKRSTVSGSLMKRARENGLLPKKIPPGNMSRKWVQFSLIQGNVILCHWHLMLTTVYDVCQEVQETWLWDRKWVRRSYNTVWRLRKHVTRYKKRLYSYSKFT